MLEPREFRLLEQTIREILLLRQKRTGLEPTKVMDQIEWGDLGQAFDKHRGMHPAKFSKEYIQPHIAIAEMKAQGTLPS